jgi:phosphoribosylformimino-5-aminoimidazole carboxamide ribotide isomerase
MLIIPAIDMKEGRCVRLRQGRMDDDTVFDEDPVAVARRWLEEGARRLHLVDLDGAFAGVPVNGELVTSIVEAAGDTPVQIGGGIRTHEIADAYIERGVRWLIIGTQAVKDPDFVTALCKRHPGHVIVGLDARDGDVATEGWAEASGLPVIDVARRFERAGVASIVYTDIGRDGMMKGVNAEATAALAREIDIPVIASGGVTNIDDIHALCAVADSGISGTIAGRALYEGTLDLAAAQAVGDKQAAH